MEKISKCCNDSIGTHYGDEGTYYYYCNECGKPTDPVEPKEEHKYDCDILKAHPYGEIRLCTCNPQPPKEEIDELVRDLTMVGSIPKSEARRRIEALIERARDSNEGRRDVPPSAFGEQEQEKTKTEGGLSPFDKLKLDKIKGLCYAQGYEMGREAYRKDLVEKAGKMKRSEENAKASGLDAERNEALDEVLRLLTKEKE